MVFSRRIVSRSVGPARFHTIETRNRGEDVVQPRRHVSLAFFSLLGAPHRFWPPTALVPRFQFAETRTWGFEV